ncbi:MAG: tellurite resistance TerB family protein [Rhodospirillales bacterium]|nr:tellurite resistance TerB family protein [Rhodospirillales bacterium]
MAGFFDILIAHHKKNKLRDRNFDYFKACMAAAALAAMADDELARREDATLKKLMKVVVELKLFGKDYGIDMFSRYIKQIRDDPVGGRAGALQDVAAAKGDDEWTTTLLMLAATIMESDGSVVQAETDTLASLAILLEIDPKSISALDLDIKDEIYK